MRRFVFSEGTSNKFWEIEVEGQSVTTRYGRIGSDGQTTQKKEASPEKAKLLCERLIREKTGKGYVEERAANISKPEEEKPPAPKPVEKRSKKVGQPAGTNDVLTELLDLSDNMQWEEVEARIKALPPLGGDASPADKALHLWIEARKWMFYPDMDMRKASKLLQQAIDAYPSAPADLRARLLGKLANNLTGAKKHATYAEAVAVADADDTKARILLSQANESDRNGYAAALEVIKLALSGSLSPAREADAWSHHARLLFMTMNKKDRSHVDKELAKLGLPIGTEGELAAHRKAVEVGYGHAPLASVLWWASLLMGSLGAAGQPDEAKKIFERFLPDVTSKSGTELDPSKINEWFDAYIEAAEPKDKTKLENQRDKLWGAACDVWNARKEAKEKETGASRESDKPDVETESFESLDELFAAYPRWADTAALLDTTLKPSDPSPWAKLAPLPKSMKTKLTAWRDGIAATAAPIYGTGGKKVIVRVGGSSAKVAGSWPTCGGCDAHLYPLVEIDLDAVSALLPKKSETGSLSMLFCMTCYPTDQEKADDQGATKYILSASGAKDTKRPIGSDHDDDDKTVDAEALKLAPTYSFPSWTEAELPETPSDVAIAHLGELVDEYQQKIVAEHGSMGVGGYPRWDQGEESPECEACGKPMQLLLQHNDIPYPDAFFYLFICARTAKCHGVEKPKFVIQ